MIQQDSKDDGSNSEALIYIHGYSNTFQDAIRETAHLGYRMRFKGVALLSFMCMNSCFTLMSIMF
jgi:esterase/lipase superfamily enzyme